MSQVSRRSFAGKESSSPRDEITVEQLNYFARACRPLPNPRAIGNRIERKMVAEELQYEEQHPKDDPLYVSLKQAMQAGNEEIDAEILMPLRECMAQVIHKKLPTRDGQQFGFPATWQEMHERGEEASALFMRYCNGIETALPKDQLLACFTQLWRELEDKAQRASKSMAGAVGDAITVRQLNTIANVAPEDLFPVIRPILAPTLRGSEHDINDQTWKISDRILDYISGRITLPEAACDYPRTWQEFDARFKESEAGFAPFMKQSFGCTTLPPEAVQSFRAAVNVIKSHAQQGIEKQAVYLQ